eukprot:gene37595-46377_t
MVFNHHYMGLLNPYGPNEFSVTGAHAFADLYLTQLQSAPDLMITLNKDIICKHDAVSNEVWITFKLRISMTKVKLVHIVDYSTTTGPDAPRVNDIKFIPNDENDAESPLSVDAPQTPPSVSTATKSPTNRASSNASAAAVVSNASRGTSTSSSSSSSSKQ